MDDTVIREIANQLGMATDQAAQFIETYLPQYASLKVMLDTAYCIIALVVFVMLLIAFLVIHSIYEKREANPDILSYENEGYEFASIIAGSSAVVSFIVLIVICAVLVPDAIAWSQFPEAQLINQAIAAIAN